jgi:ribosomal protein S4E
METRFILLSLKNNELTMSLKRPLKDGEICRVVAGVHKGKSGKVGDIKMSKSGHITVTIRQSNGVRFKTLCKNLQSSGFPS